jgi:esterase/lipase superfamily enzyme
VFVGQLAFRVMMEPLEGAQFQPAIQGFALDATEPEQVTLTSEKEVPFAFRAFVLNLDVADPSDLKFEPATTSRATASPWELAAGPLVASANGHTKDDGHEVTVLYATCRAVDSFPPAVSELMSQFIRTANGLATAAVIVVVFVVGAIGLGYMKRLTLLPMVAGGICGLLLFLGIAWVDAKRQQSLAAKVTGVYGNKRGELKYGICKVSVPKQREPGQFNTPFAFYVIQLPEDPEKHFVVTELQEHREEFFRELQAKVSASRERNAFVFIHGYNVPFPDAVKRTAQLTVDLEFAGAPICYSWPSQGDLAEYLQDSTNAELAAYKLKQLLLDLNAESGAKEIHLVAHSMGNDVLTRALKELGKDALGHADCVYREVLLTAPDIDTEIFETQILPAFLSPKQRITLYASANDKALNASFDFRGSPRAGLAGKHLLVAKGVETIDVSALDTGFLGHAYYGDHPLVVGDMLSVLQKHLPPGERGLQERAKNGLPYWEFVR